MRLLAMRPRLALLAPAVLASGLLVWILLASAVVASALLGSWLGLGMASGILGSPLGLGMALAPSLLVRNTRSIAATALVAAAITLNAAPLSAAPFAASVPPDATPLTHKVQGDYYGGYTYGWGWGYGYNYKPACPYNYHYESWFDPYGYRHCGCLRNTWW